MAGAYRAGRGRRSERRGRSWVWMPLNASRDKRGSEAGVPAWYVGEKLLAAGRLEACRPRRPPRASGLENVGRVGQCTRVPVWKLREEPGRGKSKMAISHTEQAVALITGHSGRERLGGNRAVGSLYLSFPRLAILGSRRCVPVGSGLAGCDFALATEEETDDLMNCGMGESGRRTGLHTLARPWQLWRGR